MVELRLNIWGVEFDVAYRAGEEKTSLVTFAIKPHGSRRHIGVAQGRGKDWFGATTRHEGGRRGIRKAVRRCVLARFGGWSRKEFRELQEGRY